MCAVQQSRLLGAQLGLVTVRTVRVSASVYISVTSSEELLLCAVIIHVILTMLGMKLNTSQMLIGSFLNSALNRC